MVASHVKRTLQASGSALGLIGVVFVIIKLSEYKSQVDFSQFTNQWLLALCNLAIIYAAAIFF
ncbi:MAG: hypothetical protein ACXWT1_19200 [Methylobacter sp.]